MTLKFADYSNTLSSDDVNTFSLLVHHFNSSEQFENPEEKIVIFTQHFRVFSVKIFELKNPSFQHCFVSNSRFGVLFRGSLSIAFMKFSIS